MYPERSSRSCCCCFYFGIRMGSIILLSLELAALTACNIRLSIELLSYLLHNGIRSEIVSKSNEREMIFIFLACLLVQISIIFGLMGMKKKNPSLLIPYFMYKGIVTAGIIYILFALWIVSAASPTKAGDLLESYVIIKLLFLSWNIYSFMVIRMQYMEMQEDSNRGQTFIRRQTQSATARPYDNPSFS